MSEEVFDFGFTAVAEDELEVVRVANAKEDEMIELQTRLDSLYRSVLPLVSNLKKNPEKDYIYWPNRLDKVKAFESIISKIYNGS